MRVLVVDPRRTWLVLYSNLLGPWHVFVRASTVREAARTFRAGETRDPFDVVFAADTPLVEDGLAFLHRVRDPEAVVGTVLVSNMPGRVPNAQIDVVAQSPVRVESMDRILRLFEHRRLRRLVGAAEMVGASIDDSSEAVDE